VYLAFNQTSPGKSAIFPSIYLLHLLYTTFGRKDFVLSCKLIQWYLALYEVRVPQTGGLPPASFRFRVTADTLALSYCYFCLHSSGLSPYRLHPCWAHMKKDRAIGPVFLLELHLDLLAYFCLPVFFSPSFAYINPFFCKGIRK
jgi:hypothetical protein